MDKIEDSQSEGYELITRDIFHINFFVNLFNFIDINQIEAVVGPFKK